NYTDVLGRNPLFMGLGRHAIGRMIRDIHHQVKKLNKGAILANEGDPVAALIILVQGTVAGEMIDDEGNVLRVETISAPRAIATAFLFGKMNAFPVTITALEETRLLMIPKDTLPALFASNRVIMQNFLDMISDRAQFLSRRIRVLSIPDLRGKLAYYLLEQMSSTGHHAFSLPHTQQELAEQFGVTRPSVGRTLRELHNKGYITARGKSIKILNEKGLSQLIRGMN
ncbi:MAG: Crp/Fnr family transcriptional regulator, partial [Bacteroidales bacterium]|nr:Crp/Fnr family transcriptional regulator [Bacteroidales bacterium]